MCGRARKIHGDEEIEVVATNDTFRQINSFHLSPSLSLPVCLSSYLAVCWQIEDKQESSAPPSKMATRFYLNQLLPCVHVRVCAREHCSHCVLIPFVMLKSLLSSSFLLCVRLQSTQRMVPHTKHKVIHCMNISISIRLSNFGDTFEYLCQCLLMLNGTIAVTATATVEQLHFIFD